MPVYNGQKYLEQSLCSILQQSFADFELLVIDDGSRDHTPLILQKFIENDPRVRVITQSNHGIVAALNRGVHESRGDYIARADSDDLCHRDRLRVQYEFMRQHAEAAMVCSSYYKLYPDGLHTLQVLPSDHASLLRSQFKVNLIMHSSVMIRKHSLLEAGAYDEKWRHVEDYELWFRLAQKGRLASIEFPLSTLRVHDASVSAVREQYQVRCGVRLRLMLLNQRRFPMWYSAHLIKPILKSICPKSVLQGYRRVLHKTR